MPTLDDDEIARVKGMIANRTRVDPDTGCVEWLGSSMLWTGRRQVAVTAAAWAAAGREPIPDRRVMRRRCENRRCVNADHFFADNPGGRGRRKISRQQTYTRGSQLRRAVTVLRELTRSPWTLSDLAAHLDCNLRTLYHDVALLESVGIAIHRSGALHHADRDSVRVAVGLDTESRVPWVVR